MNGIRGTGVEHVEREDEEDGGERRHPRMPERERFVATPERFRFAAFVAAGALRRISMGVNTELQRQW